MVPRKQSFYTEIHLISQSLVDMLMAQKIMMSCARADDEIYLIHVGDRLSVKLMQIQNIIVVYVL